jgi:prophage regulatory protein
MRQMIRGAAKLAALLEVSETWLWREEKAGRFPARVQLGAQAVGWYEDEIAKWLASRPRGPRPSPVLAEQAREAQRKRHGASA